jgi:ribosomal protein L40E
MARKSVGYVELQWTCPNCQTKNRGSQRICLNCGSPQPDNVEFEQANQAELIKAEERLKQAKAGPDIHCYYCGSRNPAGTANCSQCGADLSEGARRKQGQVIGARRTGPAAKLICPSCHSENEPNAPTCRSCGASLGEAQPAGPVKTQARPATSATSTKYIGWIIAAVVLFICGVAIFLVILSARTEETRGRVQDVSWRRSIIVEGLVPVSRESWRNEIPAGVRVGYCTPRLHHTQSQPAPNAKEVCGTPFVVDQGSGYGEVVQECEYQVYEDYCEYQTQEWQPVDTLTADGAGLEAFWPALSLNRSDQRIKSREESYQVIFATEAGQYTYTTRDPAEFAWYQIGSTWILQVNTFGAVVSTEPAN